MIGDLVRIWSVMTDFYVFHPIGILNTVRCLNTCRYTVESHPPLKYEGSSLTETEEIIRLYLVSWDSLMTVSH